MAGRANRDNQTDEHQELPNGTANGVQIAEHQQPNVPSGRTDPPTHKEDPILSLGEVGRQLGKSSTTVKRWIMDGLLRAVTMPSGLHGVRKSEVNKFLGGSAITRRVK